MSSRHKLYVVLSATLGTNQNTCAETLHNVQASGIYDTVRALVRKVALGIALNQPERSRNGVRKTKFITECQKKCDGSFFSECSSPYRFALPARRYPAGRIH